MGIGRTALTLLLTGLLALAEVSGQPSQEPAPKPAVDLDAPPRTEIQILPDLGFGARAELEYELEKNFDFDSEDPDDLWVLEPKLSLALSYTPTKHVTVFTNIEPSWRFIDDDEGEKENETRLELKQAFVSLNELFDRITVKLGRQRFNNEREWLYDEELDGMRVFYFYQKFSLDLSVSEQHDEDLLHGEEDERVTNYVLHGRYTPDKDTTVGIYSFIQNDRKRTQEDLQLYGLHVHGEPIDDLEYWLELAHVRGENGPRKIRAIGFDIGATYEFNAAFEPSLTLGYAFGSGDDEPADNIDENFRQTGLQDNEAKFNGVVKLKYYGEMIDPELSNLAIATVGVGIRPTHTTSLDLVYHYYRQDEASEEVRDAEIDEQPNGFNADLGQEIDLVAGYRIKPHHKGSLVIGYFIPSTAFPDDADPALFTKLEIQYEF
jgi:alginate production protein